MSDTHVADDVVMGLAVARGNVNEAWRTLDDLRGLRASAERALDDAAVAATRVRLVPDGLLGASYLSHAGQQLNVLRQRCTLAGDLATQIEERLATAKQHIDTARARLDGPDLSPEEETAVSSLRTRIEDFSGVVDLARPLAHSTRTHMQEAAEVAGRLVTPPLDEARRQAMAHQVHHSVQAVGRSVARADEASRHLDRAVEHAQAGEARSFGHADTIAESAYQRLRAAQQAQPPSAAGQPLFGTAR